MARYDKLMAYARPGECIELDLGSSEVREAVVELYGGAEAMRARFPQTAAALDRAAAGSLPRVGEPTDFGNDAVMPVAAWDERAGSLCVHAVASLESPAYSVDGFLLGFDAGSHKVIDVGLRSYGSTHQEIECTVPFTEWGGTDEYAWFAYMVLYTMPDESGEPGPLNSLFAARMISRPVLAGAGVSAVMVRDPAKLNPGKKPPVNVCYNRRPGEKEDVDYIFPESFNPATGVQRLFVPVSAAVVLEEGKEFDRIDISTFALKLDGYGTAVYQVAGRRDDIASRFVATDEGFSFVLDPDWKDDVPARRLPTRDRVDLYCSVEFLMTDGTRSGIELSSTLGRSVASSASVAWLQLLWGCVAAGTLVEVEGTGLVPIERVRAGQRVRGADADGADAGFVAVRRVIRGTEERLLCVEALDGARVRCSDAHPVLTDEGYVRADALRGGMRVLTRASSWQPLTGVWETPGGDVVTLELEGGGAFWADGVLVGDNAEQAALDWRPEEVELAPNPFLAEADAFQALPGCSVEGAGGALEGASEAGEAK